MSSVTTKRPSPWQSDPLLAVLLFVLTLVLFSPVAGFPFYSFDDPHYVTDNAHVLGGLSWSSVKWALTEPHFDNWHPVTTLSHLLDVTLFGDRAAGHHIVNLFLHAANAALVFLALRHLTGARWRSLLVAALFAWHPLRVESVAWISDRKDLLCAFFSWLTILAYVWHARNPGWRRFTGVVCFCGLALLSKASAITLPCVLLLLDFWPLKRLKVEAPTWADIWPMVREKLPLFGMVAAISVITLSVQTTTGSPYWELPGPGARLSNVPVVFLWYVEKTLAPFGLCASYEYPARVDWLSAILGVALIAGLCWLAWRERRRNPWLGVGWLWYLGTLAPLAGLIQSWRHLVADRYSYFPMVGVYLIAVWGGARLLESRPGWRRPMTALAVSLLVACAGWSFVLLSYWRSDESLNRRIIEVSPGNTLAYNNLGISLANTGRLDEARKVFEQSLAIRPRDYEVLGNLSSLCSLQGDAEGSLRYLREAIRVAPDVPSLRMNLALMLDGLGRPIEAVTAWREFLEQVPGDAQVRRSYGDALSRAGQFAEAAAEYDKVLSADPSDLEAASHLAAALNQSGRYDAAARTSLIVLKQRPDDWESMNNLAYALTGLGRTNDAIVAFERVLRRAEASGDNGAVEETKRRLRSLRGEGQAVDSPQ